MEAKHLGCSMKLRIERKNDKVPEPVIVEKKSWPRPPVGWWNVTTEGDCEGRSTKSLGWHYGHVVEIALSLQRSPCFRYQFSPWSFDVPFGMPGEPTEYPHFAQVRDTVDISLDIRSGTWDMKPNVRVDWFREWFDSEDVEVASSCYYASVKIKLKD